MIYRVGFLSFFICMGLFALVAYACACPPPSFTTPSLTSETGLFLVSESGPLLTAE